MSTNRYVTRFLTVVSLMALPVFTGRYYERGGPEYKEHCYQYGSSSHDNPSEMLPALIIYPANDDDIIKAIHYAKERRIAIAVRTGGHQYSGASSTGGDNIQLDLSQTFTKLPQDFQVLSRGEGMELARVRTSISWALAEFNAMLQKERLFVPHGQCSHVHLGGHVQTGGYGQLGRSFGLFGDHVESLEIILADGVKRSVSRDTDPELFWAVLGGSPGNFGVITHLIVRAHRDEDHPNARGTKIMHLYSYERLRRLLQVLVDMANTPDLPADFDFCLSVLSFSTRLYHLFPNLDEYMQQSHPELYGSDGLPRVIPPVIVLYVQWANTGGKGQAYDRTWFDRIRDAGNGTPLSVTVTDEQPTPMSKLTPEWIFLNVREYTLPYEKRAYLTHGPIRPDWAEWVSGRVHEIQRNPLNGCKLSIQIQNFGGEKSKFYKNRDNGTSYSWRDTSIVCVMDCFFEPHGKATALEWQAGNDAAAFGPEGYFGPTDRRSFWGSHGSHDLNANWHLYYEDEAKYRRLREVKQRVDPDDVFTPNAFALFAQRPSQPLSAAHPAAAVLHTDGLATATVHEAAASARVVWNDAEMEAKNPKAFLLPKTYRESGIMKVQFHKL